MVTSLPIYVSCDRGFNCLICGSLWRFYSWSDSTDNDGSNFERKHQKTNALTFSHRPCKPTPPPSPNNELKYHEYDATITSRARVRYQKPWNLFADSEETKRAPFFGLPYTPWSLVPTHTQPEVHSCKKKGADREAQRGSPFQSQDPAWCFAARYSLAITQKTRGTSRACITCADV
jgi:hypothetical protein